MNPKPRKLPVPSRKTPPQADVSPTPAVAPAAAQLPAAAVRAKAAASAVPKPGAKRTALRKPSLPVAASVSATSATTAVKAPEAIPTDGNLAKRKFPVSTAGPTGAVKPMAADATGQAVSVSELPVSPPTPKAK